jgi:hypothetical protein
MKNSTSILKEIGPKEGTGASSPIHLIDARIAGLADWRGETLARVQRIIKRADPDVVEEWKWRGPPPVADKFL